MVIGSEEVPYWIYNNNNNNENLSEFYQISLKILVYLTDFSPQFMACMLEAFLTKNTVDPDQTAPIFISIIKCVNNVSKYMPKMTSGILGSGGKQNTA